MPEIAEVETVRKVLKREIVDHRLKDINVRYPKIIVGDAGKFKDKLVGQKFTDIKRLGKWLIMELNDYYLLSHMRMEGKYFIKNHDEEINKHEHIIISLDNNKDLRYHDTRKFGRMILTTKDNLYDIPEIKKQGIEVGSSDLTLSYLKEKLHHKKLPIKTVLLDQSVISGLGNIYVNEVLFASCINPLKEARTLNDEEIKRIISSSKEIINEAIEMGGTTIKSYTSSLGVEGNYQSKLQVQGRENQKCFNCGSLIKKIKVGGRGTYYCPNCQK